MTRGLKKDPGFSWDSRNPFGIIFRITKKNIPGCGKSIVILEKVFSDSGDITKNFFRDSTLIIDEHSSRLRLFIKKP